MLTALAVFFIGLSSTIDYLTYVAAVRQGLFYIRVMAVDWGSWPVLLGAVIAIIFICLRRKEWQEIPDSVDGKVSYGG